MTHLIHNNLIVEFGEDSLGKSEHEFQILPSREWKPRRKYGLPCQPWLPLYIFAASFVRVVQSTSMVSIPYSYCPYADVIITVDFVSCACRES